MNLHVPAINLFFVVMLLFTGNESKTSDQVSRNWILADLLKNTISGITILGQPHTINSEYGEAVYFDGIDDGIILDDFPLTGVSAFTIEAIVRPDSGGNFEQRFFHTGSLSDRVLLELRNTGNQWFADAFIQSGNNKITMADSTLNHKCGQWHHFALVADNGKLTTYIDHKKELEATIDFTPLQYGQTSLGVRLNKVSWFRGSIYQFRISSRALQSQSFLKLPKAISPE